MPPLLAGGVNLGFMFLPTYRGWVVVASLVVCLGTWFVIERTKLGAYLRAATENPTLVQAFGINVPLHDDAHLRRSASGWPGFAGVLAAPIYQVSPLMGSNLIIVVFAVVVIGGMGSILGAIVTGFMLGIARGPDQGVLSGGLQHRDLRRHGDRAADQARRPVRTGDMTDGRDHRSHRPAQRHARAPVDETLVVWRWSCCWLLAAGAASSSIRSS